MRSSNPVLTRLTPETQTDYRSTYAPAGYSQQTTGYAQQAGPYSSPVVATASDRLTIDDVVVRTVALLALTGVSAFLAILLVPRELAFPAVFGAAMVGLVLGLIISFKRITNPPLILAYAVIEGVAVGIISKIYESAYSGIVVQALVGTFSIFLIMTALYKFRVIRATPKFARGLMGAVIGVIAILFFNMLASMAGLNTHLRDGSGLSIVVSLVIIVIGALTFILDFDLIERSIAAGAPKKTAWTCAFGLLVSLIWVYLEVLRLLSYLRGRN